MARIWPQVAKPLQPSSCNFFSPGTLASAMQGKCMVLNEPGRGLLAMHLDAPTAPQVVQESGSLEQE